MNVYKYWYEPIITLYLHTSITYYILYYFLYIIIINLIIYYVKHNIIRYNKVSNNEGNINNNIIIWSKIYIHEGILKDLWAFEIEEVILPIAKPTNIKDYIDTTNDVEINPNRHSDIVFEDDGVDMGEKAVSYTHLTLPTKRIV